MEAVGRVRWREAWWGLCMGLDGHWVVSDLCQGVRKSCWSGLGLGCGVASAGPEAVSWQNWVRLWVPSGAPQAGESTPGQAAECFPALCMCGRVSHCLRIRGARPGTRVQTKVIDSLAGRPAALTSHVCSVPLAFPSLLSLTVRPPLSITPAHLPPFHAQASSSI